MVSRVMHAIIGIEHINFVYNKLVSELMVFVQESSPLYEEEDVKSMEFGGGIKMKKTTRKFRFVLR